MHIFASLAVLLSFGAQSVLSGHVLAPARPAPQAFERRQTSREQVVRRMTHGMRRINKRQSQPSSTPKYVDRRHVHFCRSFSRADGLLNRCYAFPLPRTADAEHLHRS